MSFTKASPHDSTQLENLLSGDEWAIFADKAYPSKDLKIRCRLEGTYNGVLAKAYRNNPLSKSQKARNTRKRRVRLYLEHPFSAITGRYGRPVAKTKTKLLDKARFVLAAICWNIEPRISWVKTRPNPIRARAG